MKETLKAGADQGGSLSGFRGHASQSLSSLGTMGSLAEPSAGKLSAGGKHSLAKFYRNGGESFLLGLLERAQSHISEAEKQALQVVRTGQGLLVWKQPAPAALYSVVLASPKKESKMKGLKSFIAYQITPSFSGIVVSRRYKVYNPQIHCYSPHFRDFPFPHP